MDGIIKQPGIATVAEPDKAAKPAGIMSQAPVPQDSATLRAVDQKNGTVSGQLDSILAQDGVHMQRARANALAMASESGLRNSSIAVGAAQGALIDRATPIAQADANIYDGAARDNQAAQNNLTGIMTQQKFTAAENEANRKQQTMLQQNEQAAADKRQADQIAAQERDRASQQALQRELFDKEQAAAAARAKETFDNTLKQMGYQNELANKNLPMQRQAELAAMTTDRINQILADGNLAPDAKQGAIRNVIDNANATAAMYEKMYNVPMPAFQMPGPANYVQAPGYQPQPAPAPSGGGGGMWSGVSMGTANLLAQYQSR